MAKKEYKVLNDFQHARLRTEMYFGSRDPHTQTVLDYTSGKAVPVETTWIPAIYTAFREILDNALDEVIRHRHGDRIDVTFCPKTMVFSVRDNGRGIPIAFDEEQGKHAATLLLSVTKAGRNFEDRGASRGMNGIGASVVNYCSEYMQIDIVRDGQEFSQRFSEGSDDLVAEEPIIFPARKGAESGTRVEFKLSKSVFPRMDLPESFIISRLMELTVCYPSLKLFYNGQRVNPKGSIEKLFPSEAKPIKFSIREGSFSSDFWLFPKFLEDSSEMSYGLVNGIPTFNGGTHIDAFRRNFYTGLLQALAPTSRKRRLEPNRSDIADGLLIFNVTEMESPSFDSQNKARLIHEECSKIITKAMGDPDFFKKVIRTYPDWIEDIYNRCALRTKKKDDLDAKREAKKILRTKVKDLEDASGINRQKCILFIGEGRSAISGVVEARDADIHGGLPLRGKVLNVHGESIKTILANEALSQIMRSIGLDPNKPADRRSLRYGKVYITTDADEDGKNIAALLVNFFFRLWPELFQDPKNPFVYIFDTPLIIAVKGKTRKYWYNDNYEEFDPEAYKGWEITRAKGLAALKREDWKYVLDNPKVTPVLDDGKLAESLSLLFDPSRADDRKDWIGM